ncbi:tetratricopeptide repeat protein [Paenibacillus tarimensis]
MEADSIVRKAYESILSGDFEQAIRWFEQAIAADPDNADYHYRCSITHARSGKWHKALEYAKQAVTLRPDQSEYSYHLNTVKAKVLVAEASQFIEGQPQNHDGAIALLHEATRLDPLNGDAFLLLGAAYNELMLHDEAAAHLREALQLNPEHAEANRLLAEIANRKRVIPFVRSQRRKRRRNR